MLRWRLLGALVTIVPLITLLWLEDRNLIGGAGFILVPVAAFAIFGAAAELTAMMAPRIPGLRVWATALVAAGAFVVAAIPVAWQTYPVDCPIGTWGWTGIAFILAMALFFMHEMMRYQQPGETTIRLACSILVTCYCVLPLTFLLHLRRLDEGRWGVLMLVSVVLIVKLSDAGAYFVGRFLGRHKMAPVLSPKKTWEGAVGAILAGALGATAFMYAIAPALGSPQAQDVSLLATLAYGASLSVAGMIGDLSESLLKRDLQTKDSASWLPGLGGMLDVLDSLTFASPLAYLWWVL